MKVCSTCKVPKRRNQFPSNGSGKLRASCRKCERKRRALYSKTLRGYITDRWRDLNSRTVNGSHPEWKNPKRRCYLDAGVRLEITRPQLASFIEAHWDDIREMIDDGLKPVIDRIDASGHYALGNIQVISSAENQARKYCQDAGLPI